MSAPSLWRYALAGFALLPVLSLFRTAGPEQGSVARQFDLPIISADAEGQPTFRLPKQDGKPLLIEVFASWCGACRHSAPALASAHARHGNELTFVGVSVDRDFEAARRAKNDWGIPYPVLYDADGSFARAYRINVLPTFVLVDAAGRIRDVETGVPSAEQLNDWAEVLTR